MESLVNFGAFEKPLGLPGIFGKLSLKPHRPGIHCMASAPMSLLEVGGLVLERNCNCLTLGATAKIPVVQNMVISHIDLAVIWVNWTDTILRIETPRDEVTRIYKNIIRSKSPELSSKMRLI